MARKLYYTALIALCGITVFAISRLAEFKAGYLIGLVILTASPYISLFIVSRAEADRRRSR